MPDELIATGLSAEDRAFLQAFETGQLPPADFHHREHIRAAWAMLCLHEPAAALVQFCAALRRFAARAGSPGLYHETITWAYLLLVHERLARDGRGLTFAEFAARNADLFAWRPSILDRHYRPEVLGSDLARRVFVFPAAAFEAGDPAEG